MRILLSTFGSRGDVEPIVALGARLKAHGAEATISAPPDPEFSDLVARAGLTLTPAFSPLREWVAGAVARRDKVGLPVVAAEVIAAQYDAISALADGCEAIVATGLLSSAAAARSVADKRGLKFFCVAYCPLFLPAPDQRPYEFKTHPHPAGVTDNRTLWKRDAETLNTLIGEPFNAHRASIGLAPIDDIRSYVQTRRPLLASDPVLSPWRPSDLCDAVQTGAWILPDERPLSPELEAFLAAGEPPVYVGFGSMQLGNVRDTGRITLAAVREKGRRIVLARGWADLMDDAEDCLVVGDVNQKALFPRVAAVVHHGGAGTTTAAALCGAPQLVVPQLADQPYWAGRVSALGVGAAHDGPDPTLETMAAPLEIALRSKTRERAKALAGEIVVDGADRAARLLLGDASLSRT